MFVYIIGDYQEHGTENVAATLKRDAVKNVFLAKFEGSRSEWLEEGVGTLHRLLERSDDDLWGGGVFYVVKLVE